MKKIDVKKLVGIAVSACVIFSAFTSCTEEKWNKNSSINVLSREDGSGTRGAFIELFGVEKKNAQGKKVDYTTDEASITNSTAVMLTTVAGNKYAIGYVSLGSLSSSVKAVKIDGVSATVDNINNGSYKIARPFNVAVRNNLSNAAQDFLNYILSSDGQNIIAANKYIKVPATNSYNASGISGKIVVAGSSSVSPVMEKLIEAYKALNPSVQIELQTSDSTTGVINAIDGTCDIGMASRVSIPLAEQSSLCARVGRTIRYDNKYSSDRHHLRVASILTYSVRITDRNRKTQQKIN